MARKLQRLIRGGEHSRPIHLTIGVDGEEQKVELPPHDFPALVEVFTQIAKGKAVFVMPVDYELSTQQAADLLNVSRPFLIKLLESEQIPFRTVGAWRRVRLSDVLSYKHKTDERSRAALQELADQAQDLKMGY